METKWLEDFVSLAETRSFSRSAQLRHVTQPAFSRRIQALEGWAGTDLVDRSSYPDPPHARRPDAVRPGHRDAAGLQSTRAMLRGHSAAAQDVIEFAVPHTLAFTFFPAWVTSLREPFGPLKSRLIALNVHDAVLRLVEGSCDLLIAYHHPVAAAAARCQPLRDGEPGPGSGGALGAAGCRRRAALPAAGPAGPAVALPRLCAGRVPGARGRPAAQGVASTAIHLDRVYETDMAEGLKVMALEGHGIAFLPQSAVRKEVARAHAGQCAAARDRQARSDDGDPGLPREACAAGRAPHGSRCPRRVGRPRQGQRRIAVAISGLDVRPSGPKSPSDRSGPPALPRTRCAVHQR